MRNKGMSVVEYSLLLAIVIVGLLAMQVYVKRAVSGHWREAGDVFGFGRQFEKGVTDIK
jgi:Flp pilus assembly pilin Flp